MTAVKSPAKNPPKNATAKPATGKRRLTRQPDNYPQSGAPLPEPIEGAEIVFRVGAQVHCGMDLETALELLKGLLFSAGSVHALMATTTTDGALFDRDLFDRACAEAQAAYDRGRAAIVDARIASAKGQAA